MTNPTYHRIMYRHNVGGMITEGVEGITPSRSADTAWCRMDTAAKRAHDAHLSANRTPRIYYPTPTAVTVDVPELKTWREYWVEEVTFDMPCPTCHGDGVTWEKDGEGEVCAFCLGVGAVLHAELPATFREAVPA